MQKEILSKFILEFLSTSDRFRKNRKSDVFYISDTLNFHFMKRFKNWEKIETEQLFDLFENLGYRSFREPNHFRTCNSGLVRGGFINIDTVKLGKLRLAVRALPKNISIEKRAEIEELFGKIDSFFNSN